ncbi:MAG: MATE family efflux transporter, partial [Myxococcota bacterium]
MSKTSAAEHSSWWPSKHRTNTILTLALPIIGGMLSQNLMNLIDTKMVSELGDYALAAVGMGSFVNFLSIAFITGLAVGVQTLAARRFGAKKISETAIPLNGGLLVAMCLAIPTSLMLWFTIPLFFPLLIKDPKVVEMGVPYLQARACAILAVGMNFAFRGFWNGINQSTVYLRTIVVIHITNVFFNWVLIFGHLGSPALGATGAGIASAIATYVGTLYYFIQGLQRARNMGFLKGLPDRKTLVSTLRLGIPTATQQFFFAGGMTLLFWIIGQIGTPELAASNVLVTLFLVGILPAMGFGLA